MASLAGPLIAAIIPEIPTLTHDLIMFITGLVHKAAPVAEAAGGPLTGPAKFADVFVGVMKILVSAHATGQISILPDEALVKIIIQAVVTSMQLTGMLGGSAATPALNSIILKPGDVLTVAA